MRILGDVQCAAHRMRSALIGAGCVMAAVACGGSGEKTPAAATTAAVDTVMPVPAESLLTQDAASQSIRRGMALVIAMRDSLPKHVGNDLSCTSCHLDKGRKAFANPWVGVTARYPKFWARTGTQVSLEDRVNDCIRRGLNGTALPAGDASMRDIVAYMTWLSSKAPAGGVTWGLGVDSIAPLPPDTVRGKSTFAMYCARCHGPDGQSGRTLGVQHPGPPLWGPRSFTIASGQARIRIVSAFVHHHMPFDAPGFVADSISYDVAGYVLSKARPDFPGKELDWPKGDAPPDLLYRLKSESKSATVPKL